MTSVYVVSLVPVHTVLKNVWKVVAHAVIAGDPVVVVAAAPAAAVAGGDDEGAELAAVGVKHT